MAFQITTLNNRTAFALAKGQEKEAIECLRETFDLLSAGANNQAAAQQAHHDDDDEYDRGQHKTSALLSNVAVAPQQHTTSVTPVLNDTSVSAFTSWNCVCIQLRIRPDTASCGCLQ
jgi:hypothetical protein